MNQCLELVRKLPAKRRHQVKEMTDSASLLPTLRRGRGSPDCLECVSVVDIQLQKRLWAYCPGHAQVKGNDRADRLAGRAPLTSGLRLGRPEVSQTLPWGHKTRTIQYTTLLSLYREICLLNTTPSIAWRREAWKEETVDDLP